jgi:DNA-binding response OmpR family regulator
MKRRIYVADDEQNIRELIKSFLENEGFDVRTFQTGDELLARFMKEPADLVILDIMMPGTDGLMLCSQIRQKSKVPIFIVSARGSELDRITGITLGSDDYLTKPFSPIELTARVKAMFRRMELDRSSPSMDIVSYGDISINISTREAECGGNSIDFTPTEMGLMVYLMENKDVAVSREKLLKNVWKFDFDVDTRATDDVVKRLRKKLSSAGSVVKVESVWGYGFKLGVGGKDEEHQD